MGGLRIWKYVLCSIIKKAVTMYTALKIPVSKTSKEL